MHINTMHWAVERMARTEKQVSKKVIKARIWLFDAMLRHSLEYPEHFSDQEIINKCVEDMIKESVRVEDQDFIGFKTSHSNVNLCKVVEVEKDITGRGCYYIRIPSEGRDQHFIIIFGAHETHRNIVPKHCLFAFIPADLNDQDALALAMKAKDRTSSDQIKAIKKRAKSTEIVDHDEDDDAYIAAKEGLETFLIANKIEFTKKSFTTDEDIIKGRLGEVIFTIKKDGKDITARISEDARANEVAIQLKTYDWVLGPLDFIDPEFAHYYDLRRNSLTLLKDELLTPQRGK